MPWPPCSPRRVSCSGWKRRPSNALNARFADVDEYSLASRLSYFLWSTMPDAELMDLAARGQLRANLDAQVKRMLADPRADNLARNFTGQWVQARDVEGIASNPRDIILRDAGEEAVLAELVRSLEGAGRKDRERARRENGRHRGCADPSSPRTCAPRCARKRRNTSRT